MYLQTTQFLPECLELHLMAVQSAVAMNLHLSCSAVLSVTCQSHAACNEDPRCTRTKGYHPKKWLLNQISTCHLLVGRQSFDFDLPKDRHKNILRGTAESCLRRVRSQTWYELEQLNVMSARAF